MKFSRLLLGILLVLTFCAAAWGQTGSITGTVHDPSGAAIAGAAVVIASPERGITRDTTSNSSGDYSQSALPQGSYDITVTAPGFKKFQAKGVVLDVAQKARVDVTLEVGAATTEIVVEGANVAQVETQSSELAGVVTGKEITQLELNGRNFSSLVTLVPGVSNQTGQDEPSVGINGSVAFSMNGGRTEYNNWELDGGDNMDNGSNGTLNVYPSIDAISEFKVLTSNYGAQYGRNGSGTVEVETKSGTKAFHGNAYEFVRNDMFNARNYFEDSVPPYKKNDFGYTIGGPVYIPGVYNKDKQKTFFFWSQEWRRERVPADFNVAVPSGQERAGNFSGVCPAAGTDFLRSDFPDCPSGGPGVAAGTLATFPNNTVPIESTGTASALLGLIPAPTVDVPGAAFYIDNSSQPTTWREELVRVDHNLNDKNRVTFRYIHDSWTQVESTSIWTGSAFPTAQTYFNGPGVSMVARWTSNISPTLLNEFVASYTTDHISFKTQGTYQRPAGFAMGYLYKNGGGGKLPAINIGAGAEYNGGFYEDPDGVWPEGPYNTNPTYTYRDNLTKIVGRHNLQFGAYLVAGQKNELSSVQVNGSLNFDPSSSVSTGNAFADLLTGRIASFSQGSNQVKFYNRYKILEPYFQDDWRVTDRLTVNLGVRISLEGTYRDRYKHAYNWDPAAFDPATAPVLDDANGSVTGSAGAVISGNLFDGLVQCGVNGVPVGCSQGHLFNAAPRFGFAWDPWGNGKTAIRGGYGIFFEHSNGNEANTEGMEGQSSPLLQSSSQINLIGYDAIGKSTGSAAPTFPLSFVSIPKKVIWPYMQQWHLDVQHELPSHIVITTSYVGSKGTHLGRQLDLNQLHPVAPGQNPYTTGEIITSNDCGNPVDAFGVPTNAVTSGGASVPYGGLGVMSPAVNLGVAACGTNPNYFRPFVGIGTITRLEDKASSTYHALQVSLRKSVGALSLSVAYTYSHSIDDSSDRYDGNFVNSYDIASSRASSNFDERHMLNVGWVYDLPFLKKPGMAHKVLGGWQYSGIAAMSSGTPVNVTNGSAFGDNAGVANGVGTGSYPDVVGDPSSGVPAGSPPFKYNPAAFAVPTGLTFGNTGRNFLRNPGRVNFDMALFKHFTIKESTAFELRAEAFNVFNHTQWFSYSGQAAYPSSFDPASSDVFQYNAAHLARILQFGAKFIF